MFGSQHEGVQTHVYAMTCMTARQLGTHRQRSPPFSFPLSPFVPPSANRNDLPIMDLDGIVEEL